MTRDPSLDLEAEPGKNGAPKKFRAEDAVAFLPKEGMISLEWKNRVVKELECSDKTFTSLKLDALDRGLIKPDGPLAKRSTLLIPTEQAPIAIAESNRVSGTVAKLAVANKNIKNGK